MAPPYTFVSGKCLFSRDQTGQTLSMTEKEKIEKMHKDLDQLMVGHQNIVRRYQEKIRTLEQQVSTWRNRAEKLWREMELLKREMGQ